MYGDIFNQLGLTKNEAKIYETLLRQGESSVAIISAEAAINRRNVYDTLNRLIEKGLIFEIRKHNENAYQAVDPKKLMEKIKEKELALEKVMPGLEALFKEKSLNEAVYIYRGIEGWKNYMRDILRVGKDVYAIGAKSLWTDPKLAGFWESFIKQAEEKGIVFNTLFDHEVKDENRPILKDIEMNHKFLPKEFSSKAVIDAFGDYVVLISVAENEKIDENTSFTVIVNGNLADAFRTWHKLIWGLVSQKKLK